MWDFYLHMHVQHFRFHEYVHKWNTCGFVDNNYFFQDLLFFRFCKRFSACAPKALMTNPHTKLCIIDGGWVNLSHLTSLEMSIGNCKSFEDPGSGST